MSRKRKRFLIFGVWNVITIREMEKQSAKRYGGASKTDKERLRFAFGHFVKNNRGDKHNPATGGPVALVRFQRISRAIPSLWDDENVKLSDDHLSTPIGGEAYQKFVENTAGYRSDPTVPSDASRPLTCSNRKEQVLTL